MLLRPQRRPCATQNARGSRAHTLALRSTRPCVQVGKPLPWCGSGCAHRLSFGCAGPVPQATRQRPGIMVSWRSRGTVWRRCWSAKDWPGRRGVPSQDLRASHRMSYGTPCRRSNARLVNTSAASEPRPPLVPRRRSPHDRRNRSERARHGRPSLTLACRRPPIASARPSLRLSAAPEARRSAVENFRANK